LKLWRDGHITVAAVTQDTHKGKNASKGINKAVNMVTGKESIKVLSFSKANWGDATRGYMKSAEQLKNESWKKITERAQPYIVTKSSIAAYNQGEDAGSNNEDERAVLVDLTDSD